MVGQPSEDSSKYSRGFSLLEVMVVVVIISIVVTLATLSIDTEPRKLQHEGQRLTALMKLASDEAVMNSNEYRAVFTRKNYSFEKYSDGEWLPFTEGVFRARELPDNFSLDLVLENESVLLAETVDEEQDNVAAILFLSSGEMTPFELIVEGSGDKKFSVNNLSGLIQTEFDRP